MRIAGSPRWIVWRIPAFFALAAVACRIVLTAPPKALTLDFAAPLLVATTWHGFGLLLWGLLALPLWGAAAAHERLLAVRGLFEKNGIATVVTVLVVTLGCAWAIPLLYSSDIYAYAAYGDMARFGFDPYVYGAAHPLQSSDALIAAANWQWNGAIPVCVYGPAFVAFSAGVMTLTQHLATAARLDTFRIITSLALILCGVFAYRAYEGSSTQRAIAAATIVLNPLAIWAAVEGHNDVLMLAIVLLGFALARRQPMLGASIVALAALFKAPAGLASLAFAVSTRSPRVRIGSLVGLGLAVLLSQHWLYGLLHGLAPHGTYTPQASLQALVLNVTRPLGALAVPMTVAATMGVMLAIAIHASALLRSHKVEGFGYLAAALWIAIPNPYPWYGLWLLPIIALLPRTRIATTLLALIAAALLRYLPDAAGSPSPAAAIVLGLLAVAPLALLLRSAPASAIISGS